MHVREGFAVYGHPLQGIMPGQHTLAIGGIHDDPNLNGSAHLDRNRPTWGSASSGTSRERKKSVYTHPPPPLGEPF